MDKSRSQRKTRTHGERGGKSPAVARPPRQPTRALIAGLLWIVFMLVVWFQAPGVRLPTFFQRLVGIANALLTMLVVMFAIREYGKRYNRLSMPLLGRVSTSRIAGGIVFLAVLGWWLSPWAPIPAGQPEPDLWRLLEQGLDTPLLQVVDTNLATLVPPVPSADAEQAAKAFATNADPLRSAWVAIASSKFDEAETLLKKAPAGAAAGLAEQARAQLDVYRGRYSAASRRYAAMLKVEPRREDFLAHGALAAALGGEFSMAGGWAQQLLEQARARGRLSARAVEAANLLAAVQLLAGDYADAQRTANSMMRRDGERTAFPSDAADAAAPRDAAAANNAAVNLLLTDSNEPSNPPPSSGFAAAKELWLQSRGVAGQARDVPNLRVALARSNLGMAALQGSRYDQAETLLTESLAAWRALANPPTRTCLAINLNALARLACIEGRYPDAESRGREATESFAAANADDPSVFAAISTLAELNANEGHYDQAIDSLQAPIHDAEVGHRGLLPRHPYVAVLKLRLADIFLRAGRNADAKTTAGEAQNILEHAGLKASRCAADALRIIGLADLRQGDREQAERQLDQAQKLLRPAEEGHSTQSPSLELAELLAAQGELAGSLRNYTDAADDYHQALDQLTQLFDTQAANHPLRAEYLHALAMLLVHEEKRTEAKPLLEEALAIDQRALRPDHPSTISVMNDLASVLESTGSKEAAEKLRADVKKLRSHETPIP